MEYKSDRTNWISGPWESEPDYGLWTDTDTGLECAIMRAYSGAWCGYVRCPEDHPWHGLPHNARCIEVDRDTVPIHAKAGPMNTFIEMCHENDNRIMLSTLIDVHGSLTYSGALRDFEGHWFGFDCGHCDDLCPAFAQVSSLPYSAYRDIDYVKAECRSLAQQIKAGAD